ncbi:MAG: gliding motility protein GldM [Bacteroidia bacterium]|nr:gliding motility protein GldM [Bacteroidia bacterium]
MASKNFSLSPRQRMINLMYLVLTALLALQVSSSIVDKFVFLNQSLEYSLQRSRSASESALEALRKKVSEEGNPSEGLKAIRQAEALRKETAQIIGYIDRIKRNLIEQAGGGIDPKTGSVKNPKEETKVETYMIGSENTNSGMAYHLEKKLNEYVAYLYREFAHLGYKKPASPKEEGAFPPLAPDNQNNPLFKSDPIQRNKDFAQANFGQTPVVAALAVLTQKQSEIVRYEQEVLKKMGLEANFVPPLDKIVATASAEANTVATGSEYTAQMFLAASASHASLKMYVNGSPVRVQNGVGEVRFPAQGKGTKEWNGEIRFKVGNRDTVFRFTKQYHVVEPVLLINNKNKFPLYQNCANELETAVPALGAGYNPAFKVNNGKAIPGARPGDVTLVPAQAGACLLSVSSEGRELGRQEFMVNPVPLPTVYLGNAKGGEVNPEAGIPNVPKVYIYVRPDMTFQRTLPKEANYRIVTMMVTHMRGTQKLKSERINGGEISLSRFSSRPGDYFQVKVEQVERLNFQGFPENATPRNVFIYFYMV